MAVFQPAEEAGDGARAMIDDGLYTRFGKPAVILGQHVAPLQALIGLRAGAAFAAADSLKVTWYGQGAHGLTLPALQSVSPMIIDPGPAPGSEDVGMFATAAGAPCVYWLLGGADPAGCDGATTINEIDARSRDVPSNHCPLLRAVHRAHTVHRDWGTDGRCDDLAPALSRAAGPRPRGACPLVSVLECESAVADQHCLLDILATPRCPHIALAGPLGHAGAPVVGCGRGERVRRRRLDFPAAKTRPQLKYAKLSFRWHAYRSWLYPRAGYRNSAVHDLQKCPRGSNRRSDN